MIVDHATGEKKALAAESTGRKSAALYGAGAMPKQATDDHRLWLGSGRLMRAREGGARVNAG
jgi:hypothetical protein